MGRINDMWKMAEGEGIAKSWQYQRRRYIRIQKTSMSI